VEDMKFPKEKAVITSKIKELMEKKDYYGIYQAKDDILINYQVLDRSVFTDLISSVFLIGNFDEVIAIGTDLMKKDIETFDILYYTLLSLLANTDIYQAMSIIRKSTLLNLDEVKEYHASDGANYSNLLHYSDSPASSILSLLIVNFIEGLSREMTGHTDIDREYILFRFFDLINKVYELGFPLNVIQDLGRALKVIFNLDV
jgi:hypothetical protein